MSPAELPGASGATGAADATGAAAGPIDPGAVRVGVAPSSALEGDPVRVVAPPPAESRLFETELGEPGVLGGVASSRDGHDRAGAGTAAGTPPDPEPSTVLVDGSPVEARLEPHGPGRGLLVHRDGAGQEVRTRVLLGPVRPGPGGRSLREVVVDGWRFELTIESERLASLRERSRRDGAVAGAGGPLEVRAIIPGRIVAISVGPGDAVAAGQQLLVLEAMKMQNELRAPREGTVRAVAVAVGANVEVGDVLMVIE